MSRVRPGIAGAGLAHWWRMHRAEVFRDIVIGAFLAGLAWGATAWLDRQSSERQEALTTTLADRSEIAENLRFVRQTVIDGSELKPFAGLDLRRAHLRGLNLACRQPAGRDCADFADAILMGANLWRANLSGAAMNRTDLRNALLSFALFNGASLPNAELQGATLFMTEFQNADLRAANLSSVACGVKNGERPQPCTTVQFQRAQLSGANLRDADLRNGDFSGAQLAGADLRGADLEGADLSGACWDATTLWDEEGRTQTQAQVNDACPDAVPTAQP